MMTDGTGGAAAAATGRVNTFSMGFEAASYNELPYAREVATRFETHHREGMVNPDLSISSSGW